MTQQTAARATLSVTAVLMLGLIALQTISLPIPAAHAGMVSKTGGYTALTVVGGRTDNHEILIIIDDRGEQLFVYSAEQNRPVDLMARESLPKLFLDARAQAIGQRP